MAEGAGRTQFLRWDDLVRAQWPRSRWRLAALTLGTTVRMVGNGSLWRILQTSWPAFLALTLPALSLLVLGLLGLAWGRSGRPGPRLGRLGRGGPGRSRRAGRLARAGQNLPMAAVPGADGLADAQRALHPAPGPGAGSELETRIDQHAATLAALAASGSRG
jgi:hypothetical protein